MAEFDVNANESTLAEVPEVDTSVVETSNGSGLFGRVIKWGAAAVGLGIATGVGATIGSRVVDKICDHIEVKAAGRKAKKEAEKKAKEEQEAKKAEEAKKNEIPTSDEGKEILEGTAEE